MSRVIWLGLRELCNRAALTVSGYFRRRPDPGAESTLRDAFAELDAGLAEILGDRTAQDPPNQAGSPEPGCEDPGTR